MSGFMYSYYSSGGQLHGLDEAVPTVTTVERHAVVQMPRPAIEDCLFRMLEPHEIGRAMAFPDDYLVLGCKRERVRLFGNAVTPPVMHWLLQRCIESLGRSRTGRAA
jgi:DNA (cytosine-5)-methyltransferase 1